MTELILSDITIMRNGFCVIGIDPRRSPFRSIRPIPRRSYAWRDFPYRRGDRVICDLFSFQCVLPHIEDRQASIEKKVGAMTESELVACLKESEVARSLQDLFGCRLHPSPYGGDASYVNSSEARRSICGCEIREISFSFKFYPKVRAALALTSGETLSSLPVVDRDWNDFAALVGAMSAPSKVVPEQLERFFNSHVRERLLSSGTSFARIGLARPDREEYCWLMLDSLFPLPRPAWSQAFQTPKRVLPAPTPYAKR